MSEERQSDRGNEHLDETRQRQLEAIEQRLKRFQPRPPRIDLTAGGQAEILARHDPMSQSERSRGRWAGTVAASWVCGAVAGALAMFLVLHELPSPEGADKKREILPTSKAPDSDVPDEGAAADQPIQLAQPGPLPALPVGPSDSSRFIAAVIGHSDAFADGAERPRLTASAHLGRFGQWEVRHTAPPPRPSVDSTGKSSPRRPLHPIQKSSTSRDELLKELLRENPDSVL
jgi:hypothetical protein